MDRINTSFIFFTYLMWHLAVRVVVALATLVVIFGIMDTAELFRRLSEKNAASSGTLLTMEVMKISSHIPELLPFAVLLGAIASFQKLQLGNEIIVAKTSGISMIRLVIPAVVIALACGVFALIVIDPIASATSKRYEALERQIFGNNGRNLLVSTAGIWLRDKSADYSLIVHGESIGSEGVTITKPVIYSFDPKGNILARYNPEKLTLRQEGYWELEGGELMKPNGNIVPIDKPQIPTTLIPRELNHSNKPPRTIPVFELLNYISVLERAGLPTVGHSSYLYAQLALPLVLVGMVMIAGRFTLVFNNRSGWVRIMVSGIVAGLVFYFIKDFLNVMGSSGRLHPIVAGFAPGLIMVCLGVVLLIRADEN